MADKLHETRPPKVRWPAAEDDPLSGPHLWYPGTFTLFHTFTFCFTAGSQGAGFHVPATIPVARARLLFASTRWSQRSRRRLSLAFHLIVLISFYFSIIFVVGSLSHVDALTQHGRAFIIYLYTLLDIPSHANQFPSERSSASWIHYIVIAGISFSGRKHSGRQNIATPLH